jgi:hypothetical protein
MGRILAIYPEGSFIPRRSAQLPDPVLQNLLEILAKRDEDYWREHEARWSDLGAAQEKSEACCA